MRLYRAKDYDDLSRKAANIIAAQVIMKPDCVSGAGHRIFARWNLSSS